MIESNGKNEYTFLDFSFSPALKQQTNSQVNNNITARNEFLFSCSPLRILFSYFSLTLPSTYAFISIGTCTNNNQPIPSI